MRKILGFTKSVCQKAKKTVVGVVSMATLAMVTAMPASAASIKVNANATTAGVVGGILDVIFQIMMYLGIVLAVLGVGQFLYAYKDQNSEAQGNGIRLALIGAALIGLKALIKATGLIS